MTTRCPACGSAAWDELVAEGYGRVYSWATVHRSVGVQEGLPYTIADIMLDEGVRVYGRPYEGSPEPSQRVVFDPIATSTTNRLTFRLLDDE